MIRMIGNHICKDCVSAMEVIQRERLPIEFHDMEKALDYVRAFSNRPDHRVPLLEQWPGAHSPRTYPHCSKGCGWGCRRCRKSPETFHTWRTNCASQSVKLQYLPAARLLMDSVDVYRQNGPEFAGLLQMGQGLMGRAGLGGEHRGQDFFPGSTGRSKRGCAGERSGGEFRRGRICTVPSPPAS